MRGLFTAIGLSLLSSPALAADPVSLANQYVGTNPTGWFSNWCAKGLNEFVLRPLGLQTGNNLASSFLAFPRTLPHHGAIVILTWHHRRADHVGLLDHIGPDGVHIVSFNWHHTVAPGVVSPANVLAYVEPVPAVASPAIVAIDRAISRKKIRRHWHKTYPRHGHVTRGTVNRYRSVALHHR